MHWSCEGQACRALSCYNGFAYRTGNNKRCNYFRFLGTKRMTNGNSYMCEPEFAIFDLRSDCYRTAATTTTKSWDVNKNNWINNNGIEQQYNNSALISNPYQLFRFVLHVSPDLYIWPLPRPPCLLTWTPAATISTTTTLIHYIHTPLAMDLGKQQNFVQYSACNNRKSIEPVDRFIPFTLTLTCSRCQ